MRLAAYVTFTSTSVVCLCKCSPTFCMHVCVRECVRVCISWFVFILDVISRFCFLLNQPNVFFSRLDSTFFAFCLFVNVK